MKAVMLMFDSLNRDFLPNYGCNWTQLPNFARLAEHCATYDNFYAGSLPCMPARRELHTGRYNFLHRSWGPLEPFDISVMDCLREAAVYAHLTSDHGHYWEDGGGTYHTRYNTWQSSRGQEGDPWMGQVKDPMIPQGVTGHKIGNLWRQDWVNREFLCDQSDAPQTKTMDSGLDFILRNAEEDRWFLQIELFDPHEPFFSPERFKALYPHHYEGPHLDWPDYGMGDYNEEETEHLRMEYAALLSMCDESLGRLLDVFDAGNLWQDTMLIVNTDHGFMLGEQSWMGKNIQPLYNEIVHIPFMLWDPRFPTYGERRTALAQTIDIAPTLLSFFGAKPMEGIDGVDLSPVQQSDTKVRDAALFGVHGGHVNVTDGKRTLMRAPVTPENKPLFDYTLMPTHMSARFSVRELQGVTLSNDLQFAGCPVLKIPANPYVNAYWYGDLLFDVEHDHHQTHNIDDGLQKRELLNLMCGLMRANEAPCEQYERLGLPPEGTVTETWLAGKGVRTEFELPTTLQEIPFTPRARKAVGVILTTAPAAVCVALTAELVADGQRLTIDENILGKMLKKAAPPPLAERLLNKLKGYLFYP